MKPRAWSLLDPSTPVADIVPCTVLVFTDSEHRFVSLVKEGRDGFTMQVLRGGVWAPLLPPLTADAVVGGLSQQVLRLPTGRCALLPPVVLRGPRPRTLALWVGGSVVATVLVALLAQAPVVLLLGLFLSLIVLPLGATTLFRRPEIIGQERRGLSFHSVPDWVRRLTPSEPPEPLPAEPPPPPTERAERIREEYGRLRTDMVYRLDHPALFDPAVPTTAAFEAALVEFADDPSVQAVNKLEVRFNLARQHAERVGLGHVAPEKRGEVERAGKVARLAAEATSEGERAAALAQLQRLLDALALYYLPGRADLAEIEG